MTNFLKECRNLNCFILLKIFIMLSLVVVFLNNSVAQTTFHNISSYPQDHNISDRSFHDGILAYDDSIVFSESFTNKKSSTAKIEDLEIENPYTRDNHSDNKSISDFSTSVNQNNNGTTPENLTLDALKKHIETNNDKIFETNKISFLFNLLTTTKNFDEEFYWKGRLFKLIHKYVSVKMEKTNFVGASYHASLIKNVLEFIDRYESYKEFLTLANDYSAIEPVEHFCCTNLAKAKPEDIISIKRSYLEENSVYIKKYNIWLEVNWLNFFHIIDFFLEFMEEEQMLAEVFVLNRHVSSLYDFDSLNFEVLYDKEIKMNNELNENRFILKILSLDWKNKHFLSESVISLSRHLGYFLNNCFNEISIERMYRNFGNQRRLTVYGNKILRRISIFTRKILSKQIRKNLTNFHNHCNNRTISWRSKNKNFSETKILDKENAVKILIQVQDWFTKKNCDDNGNSKDCVFDINVFVGLF
ncbi:hypothetical protein EDEG_02913 [Edhazardia aedis USNM 41457]|uniref:Uncharacterized protein n=1 Tax=Edhazardia aedis (strain USNM 41457) TaxID=1003232 RepID=J9D4F7_EDHAE|nr:hypothetical protein EDEG_02913 [Edhazardia aedis USNM 41457]|eukprot:EJW02681.1 hypothetical protein EDEG_02913 [Edhazardia aedis USNM 41457]